jgi:hypothetical protein
VGYENIISEILRENYMPFGLNKSSFEVELPNL